MLPKDSANAVITDPPYDPPSLPVYSSLSAFACCVLKPGGWCVVMTGNGIKDDVMRRLAFCG
jgi:hypothetical protein